MPLVGSCAKDPPEGDDLAWHPNAQQTVSLSEDSTTDNDDDEGEDDDYLDGLSIHTGRYTDPGWFSTPASGSASSSTMVSKVPSQCRSRDDTAVIKPKAFCMSHKHFFCKAAPKESRQDSLNWDATPCVRDGPVEPGGASDGYIANPEQVELGAQHASTFVSPSADSRSGSAVSSATFSGWTHVPDGASVSLTVQALGALDARLSSIFAEETKKMNDQAILNAQYGIGHRYAAIMGGEFAPSRRTKPPTYPHFGALSKKGAVEIRKDELERKWAENRPPSHVKKVTWHVSSKGGGYKKKVFLDYK
jgi:hypothetical protein